MKKYKSQLTSQQGFTLLESLVALIIFSIVVFGSGLAISRMLNVQKDMNMDYIISNEMQNKLQNTVIATGSNNVCDAPSLKENIEINGKIYYVACSTEKITVSDSLVEWPVLAVSLDAAQAKACADGMLSSSCYMVGK